MIEGSKSSELTGKQEELIALLLSGVNIIAAARQIKVNESTVRRWLKLEHVKKAYREARHEVFNERLDALREGVSLAIETLKDSMDREKTKSEFVRVQAASKWLDVAPRGWEHHSYAPRICGLVVAECVHLHSCPVFARW